MSEEKSEQSKTDTMSWDEHLRAGVRGFREEVRGEVGSRGTLREFRRHQRNAMKEMLLAWRSVIDGAINRIDQMESANQQRVTKIKIE